MTWSIRFAAKKHDDAIAHIKEHKDAEHIPEATKNAIVKQLELMKEHVSRPSSSWLPENCGVLVESNGHQEGYHGSSSFTCTHIPILG